MAGPERLGGQADARAMRARRCRLACRVLVIAGFGAVGWLVSGGAAWADEPTPNTPVPGSSALSKPLHEVVDVQPLVDEAEEGARRVTAPVASRAVRHAHRHNHDGTDPGKSGGAGSQRAAPPAADKGLPTPTASEAPDTNVAPARVVRSVANDAARTASTAVDVLSPVAAAPVTDIVTHAARDYEPVADLLAPLDEAVTQVADQIGPDTLGSPLPGPVLLPATPAAPFSGPVAQPAAASVPAPPSIVLAADAHNGMSQPLPSCPILTQGERTGTRVVAMAPDVASAMSAYRSSGSSPAGPSDLPDPLPYPLASTATTSGTSAGNDNSSFFGWATPAPNSPTAADLRAGALVRHSISIHLSRLCLDPSFSPD